MINSCKNLPHYHLVLLPYSLSLKENIKNRPWLLQTRDIPPFNEMIPLVSEETSSTLKLTHFSRVLTVQMKQLRKDSDTEQEYLDRLKDCPRT